MYGKAQNYGCFGGAHMNMMHTKQPNYTGLYGNKQDSFGSALNFNMRSNALTMSPCMPFDQQPQQNQMPQGNRWLHGSVGGNTSMLCRSNCHCNMQYPIFNGATQQLTSYMNPSQSHNSMSYNGQSLPSMSQASAMATLPWQSGENYMPSIMPLTQYNSLLQQRQQQTSQNVTHLMPGYRDAAGAVNSFSSGGTTKSIVNTKPTLCDQLLNRIDSLSSFSDDHGCRRRDSLHDLREYEQRLKARKRLEEKLRKPIPVSQTLFALRETKSKKDLKNEIKELKRMLKLHSNIPTRTISQTLQETADTSPITKTQLMDQIVSLKHQLRNYKQLTDSKSKRELKQEVYQLKRRLKDRVFKQTSKWRKGWSFFGFNKNRTTSNIPPHNSDRAVSAPDCQKDKIPSRLYSDSGLRVYPRGSTNTMNNFVAIQPRFHDSWLDYSSNQEFEYKSVSKKKSSTECLSPSLKYCKKPRNPSNQNLKVKPRKFLKKRNSVKFESDMD